MDGTGVLTFCHAYIGAVLLVILEKRSITSTLTLGKHSNKYHYQSSMAALQWRECQASGRTSLSPLDFLLGCNTKQSSPLPCANAHTSPHHKCHTHPDLPLSHSRSTGSCATHRRRAPSSSSIHTESPSEPLPTRPPLTTHHGNQHPTR
jgi:hypothetical protein